MSEPMTALMGAADASGIAHIHEAAAQGMITMRGDLSAAVVARAVKAAAGLDIPSPRGCEVTQDTGVAWMSPDELLVLVPYPEVAARLAKMQEILGATHALAVNVSDARALFVVEGDHAHEVLAKLCPVDVSPEALPQGMIRRTRMAQVPAALWRSADSAFSVICFRSQARYVFDLLCVAAQTGSEIGSH